MSKDRALHIAFQGAPGAFSHRAGQLFIEEAGMADGAKYVPCRSFDEVFDSIRTNRSDLGVVPLENSSIGSIVPNYDLLWREPVMLVGEIFIPIHHHLIGFPGTQIKSLTAVYSHPAALDQCRSFLKSWPAMKPVAYWDTSGAALHVSASANRKNAAIASEFAAKEANLAVLKSNVEDHEGNRTRFGVVVPLTPDLANGSGDQEADARIKNIVDRVKDAFPHKMSCVVELPHKPGSLADILKVFGDLGVNLTKIESRPIPETHFHYRFFLDMEVFSKEQCDGILRACEKKAEKYKLLGSYRIWQEN